MPVTLTNHEAYPTTFEEIEIIGEYTQDGVDVDYYNVTTKSILPGEPVVIFGRIGISKEVILPNEFGTITFGAQVSFLVNPDMVADILQGALVYFDLDLATGLIPGYATGVQPTNGYRLGHAVGVHERGPSVNVNASNIPIAAAPGALRVLVLMDQCGPTTPTTYGTVENFAA